MSWTKDWVDELYDSGDEEYTPLKWFVLLSKVEEEKVSNENGKNKQKDKNVNKDLKNSKDWNCKNTNTNTNVIKSV